MLSKRGKILVVSLVGYTLISVFALATSPILAALFIGFVGLFLFSVIKRHIAGWRLQNRYGIRSITDKGQEVESIGEKRIADYFAKNNIRYEYEPAVFTKGWNKRLIGYPDFFLVDFNVYVEYWGMTGVADIADRVRYVGKMRWKMAQYHENGIKFISLYPPNLDNLDSMFRRKLKEVAGMELERVRH